MKKLEIYTQTSLTTWNIEIFYNIKIFKNVFLISQSVSVYNLLSEINKLLKELY